MNTTAESSGFGHLIVKILVRVAIVCFLIGLFVAAGITASLLMLQWLA